MKGLADKEKKAKAEIAVKRQMETGEAGKEKPIVSKEPRKTIFEKWIEKFRDFLENAE